MTVRELDARMDGVELSEWLAVDRFDPIPDPWRQTGLLCAVLANLWSKGKPRAPEDFIPKAPKRRQPMSGAAIRAAIRGAAPP